MLWDPPPDSRCGGTLDPAHRQRSHTSRPFSLSQVFNHFAFFRLRKSNESRIISRLNCDESYWVSFVYPVVVQILTRSLVQLWYIHNLTTWIPVCHHFQKVCTSTQILISKSGGGDLFHLFNFPSFPIQSKIAILEKECNCVCIISVCVRRCLLYFCICLGVKGAATVEKEGVWRREKFLTSLAITNTPGSCWRGQQRLFYTLVSQGWKAS